MLDEERKQELIRRFDKLAEERSGWIERNRYYYDDQRRYYRFLVPEGLSVLELGGGTGDLLGALNPRRGVGLDFSPEMIRRAQERHPELEFREKDAVGFISPVYASFFCGKPCLESRPS